MEKRSRARGSRQGRQDLPDLVMLRREVAPLRRLPGVTGVFLEGTRNAPAIGVQVDGDIFRMGRSVPRNIGGLPVRVAVARIPVCHLVDHTDEVWKSDGSTPRESTITAIRRKGSSLLVLTSGHGTLPFGENGRIVQRFVKEDHPPVDVTINDGSGGFYTGRLVAGALAGGRRVDFGVVRIGGIGDADHDSWHAATSSLPPHTVRATPVARGEVVWHISRFGNRPQRVLGTLNAEALGSVDVRLPDGSLGRYSGVLRVQATGGMPFSIPGESGGLVVDEQRLVIGTVLAGLHDQQSYVLPIGALIETLKRADFGGLFF